MNAQNTDKIMDISGL